MKTSTLDVFRAFPDASWLAGSRAWSLVVMAGMVLLGSAAPALAAAQFVSGLAPDWNQPYRYTAASPNGGPGPDPTPVVTDPWNAWCAPCSAANLMGHWADARGMPVADSAAFPGSTVLWAAGPSWQDYLADGFARPAPQNAVTDPLPPTTTDLGWYFDTNRGQGGIMGGFFFGNGNHAGTYLKDMDAGLKTYLGSIAAGTTWYTGTEGIGFAQGQNPTGGVAAIHPNAASAFGQVISEIQANRTLILSYRYWSVIQTPVMLNASGTNTESQYGGTYCIWGATPGPNPTNAEDEAWNYGVNGEALGHAVTAVGYIPANDTNDAWQAAGLQGPTDWVIVHDNWASTPRNVIIPFNFNGAWVANTTVAPAPTQEEQPTYVKWSQPPDCPNGVDIESWGWGADVQGFHTIFTVADDWLCDGRPITGLRWWGSYIGWQSDDPNPALPPPLFPLHPVAFLVTWHKDIPATPPEETFSRPGDVIKWAVYETGLDIGRPLTEGVVWEKPYCVSHLDFIEPGTVEHEYVYTLQFPATNTWNEKQGETYWLSVQAVYADPPSSNAWGWKNTPPSYNWNDDAVFVDAAGKTNAMVYPPPGWQQYPNHPYAGQSVNMAFELLTDVYPRRTRKWAQPPDMATGENMPSFRIQDGSPVNKPLRADDWLCDGRRVTDIHWWGSYLNYRTTEPGPLDPPVGAIYQPLGFDLSWHADVPAGAGPSHPGVLITNLHVSITNCHEVFYGSVFQFWKEPQGFEHEFQYYVDLLNPAVGLPWLETTGQVYWLNVQAVFPIGFEQGGGPGPEAHTGWGWKTTPQAHRWNDASAVTSNGQPWQVGVYPPGHPFALQPCDLAFELTTDEVGGGSNWWNQPIVITAIRKPAGSGTTVGSVGDAGAGVQVLQSASDATGSNWVDVLTNALPVAAPHTNTWVDAPANETSKFYRVLQK